MSLGRILVTTEDQHKMRLLFRGQEQTVSFRTEAPIQMCGEAQALVAAAAAMRLGLDIETDRPVTPGFHRDFGQAQQRLVSWFPSRFKSVELLADIEDIAPRQSGTVSFFSGGVDSYHTAIECLSQIDSLVLIHGFDLNHVSDELRAKVSSEIQDAASDLGLPLIEIDTDLRYYSDPHMDWGPHFHAMGLAAIAHLLGASSAFIPSSYPLRELFPWGSHPDIDPLLGGDAMSITHYGAESTRLEKLHTVMANASALRHLRVCFRNTDGAYNCGTCEKCTRTMLALAGIGKLDHCDTFPREISREVVASLNLSQRGKRSHAEQNYRQLRARGTHPEVASALRTAIRRGRVLSLRGAVASRARSIPGIGAIISTVRK